MKQCKNNPRAGPSNIAGESRAALSRAAGPTYTGGANTASRPRSRSGEDTEETVDVPTAQSYCVVDDPTTGLDTRRSGASLVRSQSHSRTTSEESLVLRFARPGTPCPRLRAGREDDGDSDAMSAVSISSSIGGTLRARKRKPQRPADDDGRPMAVRRRKADDTSAERDATQSAAEPGEDRSVRASADIGSELFSCLSAVEKTVDKPKSSKAEVVKSVRSAFATLKACASELCVRAETRDRENERTRSLIDQLYARIEVLASELAELRRGGGASHPTAAASRRGLPAPTAPTSARAKKGRDGPQRGAPAPTPRLTASAPQPSSDWSQLSAIMDREYARFQSELMGRLFPEMGRRPPLGQGQRREGEIPQATLTKSQRKRKRRAQRGTASTQAPPVPALAGPSTERVGAQSGTWATVVGRKAAARAKQQVAAPTRTQATPTPQKKKGQPKPPTCAAVVVTVPEGAETTIAAVMTAAKARIKLADLGIVGGVRQRKAATGALLLEVPGPESSSKADALAEKMREALADTGALISRPCKMGDLRVMDLDESITPADVTAAIAEAGGCSPTDIKIGEIRTAPSRLGTAWVRCPVGAVRKVAAQGRVQIGWTAARVEALAARPLQCYQCLELGHVRVKCPNTVDRSGRCYRCGETGHIARHCTASAPHCPVCADLGRAADHRLGTKKCSPPKNKKKKGPVQPPSPAQGSEEVMETS